MAVIGGADHDGVNSVAVFATCDGDLHYVTATARESTAYHVVILDDEEREAEEGVN